MNIKYKSPRGTQDFLPDYLNKWKYVENIWRKIAKSYGFCEIVTPMFEETALFTRTGGQSSDIVSKEMYTFTDKGGRNLSLRPEGTAPVVRAYIQHGMNSIPQPVKFFYLMPMFRYERPQAGRYRQHHQYGVEVIGDTGPQIDAEIIIFIVNFYIELGIKEPKVHLNNIGDSKCRPIYKEKLLKFLENSYNDLCSDCHYRMKYNPLRILDCKNENCQTILSKAPLPIDYLCDECQDHFNKLKEYLNLFDIPFIINPRLVRGLDYYTKTVFEVTAKNLTLIEEIKKVLSI